MKPQSHFLKRKQERITRRDFLKLAMTSVALSGLKLSKLSSMPYKERRFDMNWYAETFRKVHWDFDIPP